MMPVIRRAEDIAAAVRQARLHRSLTQAQLAAQLKVNREWVVGYVTLSAAQIERAYLPKAQQRNRPDPVPVTLLGQLAVDKELQGQGYARSLLLFALRTALHASRVIGSTGVIMHPLDDGVRRFYGRWGFQDLPFDPRRAMIVRMADLRASFGGADDVTRQE